MFCGKCGSTIPDGNSFCAKCGAPISDPSNLSSVQSDTQSVQPVPVIMMAQPTSTTRTNGAAIAGLVFGIVTICLCWVPYVGAILGSVGLILSIVGICKIRACGRGAGQAITGLILSSLGLIFGVAMIVTLNSYVNNAQAVAESQKATQTTVDPSFEAFNAEIEKILNG